MSDRVFSAMTILASVGSGVAGGLLFAFSTSIMAALGRIAPASGLAAMQAINVTILNPVFYLAFFGPALLGLILSVAAFMGWYSTSGAGWIYAGAVLYMIGVVGVTMAVNVPMNDVMATADPGSSAGAAVWADYLSRWTRWNHVRTVAGVLAALSFALALG